MQQKHVTCPDIDLNGAGNNLYPPDIDLNGAGNKNPLPTRHLFNLN